MSRPALVNKASLICLLCSIACNNWPQAQFTKLFHNSLQNLPAPISYMQAIGVKTIYFGGKF